MPIYFNGGGAFYTYSQHDTERHSDSDVKSGIEQDSPNSDQPGNKEEVLGTYHSAVGTPTAIVKIFPSRGKAILTGVHPEFGPEQFDQNDDTVKKFIKQLEDGNHMRHQCFRAMLTHLDISLKNL